MTTKTYSLRNRRKNVLSDEANEQLTQLKATAKGKRTAKNASSEETQDTSPAKSKKVTPGRIKRALTEHVEEEASLLRPAAKEEKIKKKVSFATNLVEIEEIRDDSDALNEKNETTSSLRNTGYSFRLSDCLTETSWKEALEGELNAAYFAEIEQFLTRQSQRKECVWPSLKDAFRAFELTPLDSVKVVILGQDPYHDDGQADGLAFSVRDGVPLPRSLKNIFTELEADVDGFTCPSSGSLVEWARRGVFLLNATLTVKAHEPNSHSRIGWQTFTDAVIKLISDKRTGVVFILWGGFAHKKAPLIDVTKHDVIKTFHPSPQSLSKFLGCRCFSKANAALNRLGQDPIDWRL